MATDIDSVVMVLDSMATGDRFTIIDDQGIAMHGAVSTWHCHDIAMIMSSHGRQWVTIE